MKQHLLLILCILSIRVLSCPDDQAQVIFEFVSDFRVSEFRAADFAFPMKICARNKTLTPLSYGFEGLSTVVGTPVTLDGLKPIKNASQRGVLWTKQADATCFVREQRL